MEKPIISVITVAKNCAPLLAGTLESVDRQTCERFEYIVVDGASTDGSTDVIRKSGRVDKWISEPDSGIYDAMNKGARLAEGEWILYMNAGDTFASPEVLSLLEQAAVENPDADVIYGDMLRCGDDGSEVLRTASDSLKSHRLAFCHQSVMCRRSDMLEFPFDISHRFSADFKFFKILQREKRKFVHVGFPVAKFDTSGISTRQRSKGLADNMKVILEVDGLAGGFVSIMHLLPTYVISRLRGL